MTAPDCPDPADCPVPDPADIDMRRLRTARLAAGTDFHTSFRRAQWPALFNTAGTGDARFSPLRDQEGNVVPTLYGAATRTAVLLETALHEVHAASARVISEAVDLQPRGLVKLRVADPATLIDLRDPALEHLGLSRAQLVATLPLHYRCTREWAHVLHVRGRVGSGLATGLLWNSRIAEPARADSVLFDDLLAGATSDVFILFGDRMPTAVASYAPTDRQDNLAADSARTLVELIAEQLGATIVPNAR